MLRDVEKLKQVTVGMSRFLLEFFVEGNHAAQQQMLRPLTNSNFVCDFFRFTSAPYYQVRRAARAWVRAYVRARRIANDAVRARAAWRRDAGECWGSGHGEG